MQLAQYVQEVFVHYLLTQLPLTCPPPHLNHHVLHSSGLFTLAEADVEKTRRLHLFHQDFYQLSSSMARCLFETLTLQSVQGHCWGAMHLNGRVDLRLLQADT